MKKALSSLLVLAMLCGVMTMSVFAIEGTTADEDKAEEGIEVTEKTKTTDPESTHKHDYEALVTDPTCTKEGYTTYTCACGDSYVDDPTDATGHTYEDAICTGCGATVSPYLQQLPENILGCTNLYDSLTPVKGYYTATKYDTSNGAVLSVVIPVEPGDRIAASSFGPVSQNMGSVNGIRVTYLLGDKIVTSLSAGEVYNRYTSNGYITVPDGVDAACIPWWGPSDNNWLTLGQISKDFAVHSPKAVSAHPPTCTETGYTAGEICEICNASLSGREEILPAGHLYHGNICTVCGAINLSAILSGKYVSILGDSISTFDGYSNNAAVNTTIGGNGPRYAAGTADTKPGSYCLLESVDQTWWMHFANRSGMKLLVNNSWAGSQVFGGKTSDGRVIPAAYLDRCVNLHDNTPENNPENKDICPDVIFVYLGINDYNFNRSKVGTGAVDYAGLVRSDGTYVTPGSFGEAYGIMLHKIRSAYPDAQIFAMTLLPENLYSVDKTVWEQHNAYIRAATEYENIPLVDLAENCAITWENYSGYMIDKIHPTTAGMKLISDCIETELISYYRENLPHTHTYKTSVTTPTCTKQGYTTYACACGDSYIDDYVDAPGHNFGEWAEVAAPACNAEGRDKRTCVCGYEEYRDTRISGSGERIQTSNPLDKDYFAGKTIVCIGDSITNGYGVEKGTEDYVTLLGETLRANVVNRGSNGVALSTGGSRTCAFSKLDDLPEDTAVVTILLGINDFSAAHSDTEKSYYDLGTFGTDDTTTIYGAARMWCERIVELRTTDGYEQTLFVFATPVICSWNISVTSVRDWNQNKTNVFGHTLRQYCNAIMEVCTYYGVPVLDLNMYSGMYYHSEEDNNVDYFGGDGVHPGANGHAMMASAFAEFLLEGYTYGERIVKDCGHSYEATVVQPDCTEAGYTSYRCTECYYSYESNYIDPAGHNYKSEVTAPTCTKQGYTTYTCDCGERYVDDYVDAPGHDYSAGLCTVCGEDTVTASLDGNILTLTGELVGETQILAVCYDVDGRFTAVKILVWQNLPIAEEIPLGEKVKLFFVDENWSPLRKFIRLR